MIHVSDHVLHLGLRYHILAMRMTTVFGTVFAFDPINDEWSEYMERLQFYFTANGIKDDSKKTRSVIEQLWIIDISAVMKYSPSCPFDRLFVFGIGIKDKSPSRTATIRHCSTIPVHFQAAFTLRVHSRIRCCTQEAYQILQQWRVIRRDAAR